MMSFDNFFKEPQAENGGYIWISSKSNFLSSRKKVQKLKPATYMAHDFALLILFGHILKFRQKNSWHILGTYTQDPRKYLMCLITYKTINTSKKCSSSPSHAIFCSEKISNHVIWSHRDKYPIFLIQSPLFCVLWTQKYLGI